MSELYDEWDDSPFFYFSRAAILLSEGNDVAAQTQITTAKKIWRDPKIIINWVDTLQESGYLTNFYNKQTKTDEAETATSIGF